MHISLDGYYCDPRGDMSFAHKRPDALGAGKSLFSGLPHRLELALTNTRVFGNGSVVLWYAPRG